MAQFSTFEGKSNQVLGAHGYWHETHNTYTEVSSECGTPALGLYIAAILSTFVLLNRTYRQACKRSDCEDIRTATFCIMLGMTTYCTAIAFVNFAYFFYLPAMSSLAIAVSKAAQNEFARRSSGPAETQVVSTPQRHWATRRRLVAPAAT
jgi:O-antigen ligase